MTLVKPVVTDAEWRWTQCQRLVPAPGGPFCSHPCSCLNQMKMWKNHVYSSITQPESSPASLLCVYKHEASEASALSSSRTHEDTSMAVLMVRPEPAPLPWITVELQGVLCGFPWRRSFSWSLLKQITVSGKTAGISRAVWMLGLLSCLARAQPCSSKPHSALPAPSHQEPDTNSHPTGSSQRTAVTFTFFFLFFFSFYIFKVKQHKFTLVICIKWGTSVLQHAFFTSEMEIPLTWGKREDWCPPPIPFSSCSSAEGWPMHPCVLVLWGQHKGICVSNGAPICHVQKWLQPAWCVHQVKSQRPFSFLEDHSVLRKDTLDVSHKSWC